MKKHVEMCLINLISYCVETDECLHVITCSATIFSIDKNKQHAVWQNVDLEKWQVAVNQQTNFVLFFLQTDIHKKQKQENNYILKYNVHFQDFSSHYLQCFKKLLLILLIKTINHPLVCWKSEKCQLDTHSSWHQVGGSFHWWKRRCVWPHGGKQHQKWTSMQLLPPRELPHPNRSRLPWNI